MKKTNRFLKEFEGLKMENLLVYGGVQSRGETVKFTYDCETCDCSTTADDDNCDCDPDSELDWEEDPAITNRNNSYRSSMSYTLFR